MGVEHAVGEGAEHRPPEHGHEAGHRHHVDVALGERLDEPLGVGEAVEAGVEAVPLDQVGGHVGGAGDLEGTAAAVAEHGHDGEAGRQDGLEDRAAPGGQHGQAERAVSGHRSGRACDGPTVAERSRSGARGRRTLAPTSDVAGNDEEVPMEAGWYADPTDRFERRFWNGHRWTEDVAIGTHRLRDLVQVETEGEVPFHIAPSHPLHGDPLSPPPAPTPEPGALPPPGASAAALPPLPHATGTEPMAQPVTAPGPGPGLGQHLIGVIRDRPVSRLTDAVAAVGGTLFAIGIIAAAGGDDLATAGLVVSSLALIVLGYAIVLTPLRPLRAAAVAMVAIGIVVLSFAALQSTVEDGHLGGPLALVTVLAVAAYLAPRTSRPSLPPRHGRLRPHADARGPRRRDRGRHRRGHRR